MLMYSTLKASFWSLIPKTFVSENGENISYHVAVIFPLDENGNVSDEPVSIGVKKEAVPLFASLTRGEMVGLKMVAYAPKAKICDLKKI